MGLATALNTTPDAVLYNYSYTNLILYARNLVNEESCDSNPDSQTNGQQMSDEDILLL